MKRKGVPGYHKKVWGEGRWKRVARFRMGKEIENEVLGRGGEKVV